MAYKFQLGQAQLSGALVQEGSIKLHNEAGTEVAKFLQTGIVSGSGQVQGLSLSVDQGNINSDGAGNLAATSFGDGVATLQGGALSNATTVSGSGQFNALSLSIDNGTAQISQGGTATLTDVVIGGGDSVITSGKAIRNVTTISASAGIEAFQASFDQGNVSSDGAGSWDISSDMNAGLSYKLDNVTIVDGSRNLTNLGTVSGSGKGSFVSIALDSVDVTSTAAELNKLDGTTAAVTAAKLSTLSDLTDTEIGYMDGATAGGALASKALVVDAQRDIDNINILSASYLAGDGSSITNINVGNLDAFGSDTEVQFNQNGEFGASSGFTFNGTGSVTASVALQAPDVFVTNLNAGRLPLVSTAGLLDDDAQMVYQLDRAISDGFAAWNTIAVSSSASGSAYLGDGLLYVKDKDGDDAFSVNLNPAFGDPAGGVYFGDGGGIGDFPMDIGLSTGDVFTKGHLELEGALTVGLSASIDGALTASYVRADNLSVAGGFAIIDNQSTFVDNSNFKVGGGGTNIMLSGAVGGVTSGQILFGRPSEDVNVSRINNGATQQLIAVHGAGEVYLSGSAGISLQSEAFARNGLTVSNGDLQVNALNQAGGIIFADGSGVLDDAAGFNYDATNGVTVPILSASGEIRVESNIRQNSGQTAYLNTVRIADLDQPTQLLWAGADGLVTGSSNLLYNSGTGLQVDTFLTASGGVKLESTVSLHGVGSATPDMNADSMLFRDATDNEVNVVNLGTYAVNLAGLSTSGLSASSGVLGLSIHSLANGTLDVANDRFAFKDDTDNNTYGQSFVSLATAMAGAGLAASAGVLSTQAQSVSTEFNAGVAIEEGYNIYTGSADISVALPASAGLSAGDVFVVKQNATGEVTINADGSDTIDGEALVVLESPYAAVSVVYSGVGGQFRIV